MAVLLSAWAKKKDGTMFTATDVFPEPEPEQPDMDEAARARYEGQRTLAMFKDLAMRQQVAKVASGHDR